MNPADQEPPAWFFLSPVANKTKMKHKIKEWLFRYGPAEIIALATALIASALFFMFTELTDRGRVTRDLRLLRDRIRSASVFTSKSSQD